MNSQISVILEKELKKILFNNNKILICLKFKPKLCKILNSKSNLW